MDINQLFQTLSIDLKPNYQERLRTELEVIVNNPSGINLLPYFLTLADIVNYAKRNGIQVGPRGSAAGCLLSYLLNITDIDPIKHNLPFSRFLSNARIRKGSLPDIDLDLPTSKRKFVIDYIFNKYPERVAHVCTYNTLRLKNSMQDTFRALVVQPKRHQIEAYEKSGQNTSASNLRYQLELDTAEFDTMRKSLDTVVPGISDLELLHGFTDSNGNYTPGYLETNKLLAAFANKHPEVLELTQKILGLPRSVGQHAGAIVISPVPLTDIVPVFKEEGRNVIAYDKKTIVKYGLVKYDLLGITALDYVQDCVDSLKKDNINIDLENLTENEDIYKVFTDGKCLSLFQWSTSGGARFAKKLDPKNQEDICVGVALNRPGALDALIEVDGQKIPAAEVYLKRKMGELPTEYLHPALKPILEETYGVYCFQEQVMQTMTELLGYTEEEADSIRSAISDKDVKAFDKVKTDMQILANNGWSQSQIADLNQQILAFSKYSFNSAHSRSYGTLSYITGWLKYTYPLHWWGAVLSNSTEENILKYWVEVFPMVGSVDINHLEDKFVISNGKLTPPISSIKGVGDAVMAEFKAHGPFTDLNELFSKCNRRALNSGVVQKLCIAGALDNLLARKFTSMESKLKFVLATLNKTDKFNYPEKYLNLTPYEWALEIKRICPNGVTRFFDAVHKTPEIKIPFVLNTDEYGKKYWTYQRKAVLDGLALDNLITERHFLNRPVEVCAFGFTKSLRRFSYKNNTKNAIELLLDFDIPFSTVLWPSRDEASPPAFDWLEEGQCYLFTLKIYPNSDKEFNVARIDKINLIKPQPLTKELT